MKTPSTLPLVLASLAALALPTFAQAVIFEPVDYPAGGLNGLAATGTGLTGSWTTGANVSAATTFANSAYGLLYKSGNEIHLKSGEAARVGLDGSLVDAGLLDHGATLWLSFLLRPDPASGSNDNMAFSLGTDGLATTNATPMLNSGNGIGVSFDRGTRLNIAHWNGGTRTAASTEGGISPGTTKLIVASITWGATAGDDEVVNLYAVADDLGQPAPLRTLNVPPLDQSLFNTLSFAHKNTRDNFDTYDEIRFGASYAAVTPRIATVTNTNDSGAGSLRETIISASPESFITFATTLDASTITLTSGQLTLDKNLTIDASALPNGITISGNNSSRVLNAVSGITAALHSLTITGGSATNGGGLYNAGELILTNLTLYGNTASSNGAGILNASGATLTLNHTTLANNTATSSGGGILNATGSTLTLNHATLANNTADQGGGINNLGILELENTIVAANTATSAGPDIYSFSGTVVPSGVNLVRDNAFSTLAPVPGLIGTSAAPVAPHLAPLGDYGGPTQTLPPLSNSPAIDAAGTTEPGGTDQRGAPRFVGEGLDIGAVEYQSPVVTNTNDSGPGSLRNVLAFASGFPTTITFATTLNASTIALTSGQLTLDRDLTIDASDLLNGLTIDANNASRVMEITADQTVVLDSLTLTGGRTPDGSDGSDGSDGGGISNQGTLTINNSTISGNATGNGGIGGFGFGGDGGGISNQGTLTINNSTISGNATGNGGIGGIGGDGGFGGYGGGISNQGTLTINNSTISGNATGNGGDGFGGFGGGGGGGGGGISNQGTLTINNSTISGNATGDGGGGGNGGTGGGIYNISTLTINNSTISENSAGIDGDGGTSFGGGIYIAGLGTLTINNSIVAGNSATTGPDISKSNGTITPSGTNLIGDNASVATEFPAGLPNGNGDWVGASGSTLAPLLAPLGDYGGPTETMPPLPGSPAIDSAFADSSITTDQRGFPRIVNGSPDIGAVESGNTIPALDPPVVSTFADSINGLSTDGISLREAIIFAASGSTITFDPALDGGTIALGLGQLILDRDLTIDASALAAGITLDAGTTSRVLRITSGNTIVLEGLTIANGRGNTDASKRGGGIFILNGTPRSVVTVRRCTLVNNSATSGGAIYSFAHLLTVEACTFTGNGGGFGCALLNRYPAVLRHCTIAGNNSSGQAGGLWVVGSLTLHNTIVANNTGNGSFADIRNVGQTITWLGGNIVRKIDNLSGGTPLDQDPLLAPLGDYGGPTETMPPLPGSPAIDATGEATTGTDQRGFARPNGPALDIGSVEAYAFTSQGFVDSDLDGIDDRLETGIFGDLTTANASSDFDGDGSSDKDEIANMTNARDSNDFFRILSFTRTAGFTPANPVFHVTFRTFPGLDYEIATDSGLDNFQTLLASLFTADEAAETLEVTFPPNSPRYYLRALRK